MQACGSHTSIECGEIGRFATELVIAKKRKLVCFTAENAKMIRD